MKYIRKASLFILLTFLCSYILSFFSYFDVYALNVSEISNRNACNTLNYELAYANYDGSLSTKSCYATYNEAKEVMDNSTEDNSNNLVILERNNNITEIIDAKYALIDYDQVYGATTNIYSSVSSKTSFTYIAGSYGDDAALIDFDFNTRRVKIKVSGYTGWIDKYSSSGNKQYDIIPISWVKSSNYYMISDSYIRHYLPPDMFGVGKEYYITLGPKPSMLDNGKYYSYDGNYFYKDLYLMLDDYKKGNYDNSVNKDSPYYNYYMYLSHRTKSNYTASDINDYVTKVLGYNCKPSSYPALSNQSMLYNEGNAFITAEELYGVNALMIFAVARNESGNGRSRISIEKNNMFGHNAIDSDPYASGSSYLTASYGIYAHAYKWLSYGYLQPGDYRFNGGNFGNKALGINVMYASDPYWGEKAASYYYAFDLYYGMQDYNHYSLAVKNSSDVVYPKKSPSSSGFNVSSNYYKLNQEGTPIVIVEEVKGDTVLDSDVWYKIIADPVLDSNLEYIGSSTSNPRVRYNWESYVYVPSAYFTKINNVEPNLPSSIDNSDDVVDPDNINDKDDESNNSSSGDSNQDNSGTKPEEKPNDDKPITDNPSEDDQNKEEDNKENLPDVDNPSKNMTLKDNNLYYFESLNYENNLLNLSGFLAITGMNNKVSDPISYRIIFKNVDNEIEYFYKLDRWINNVPFTMSNSDEKVKYDYSGGWFKGSIDISNLPDGDYKVYIEMDNGSLKTRANFNNLFYKDMARKFTTSNGKGFNFQMNYYEKSVPLELSVRSEGLISKFNPPTIDVMYNSYEKLTLNDKFLSIRGTSHNIGVDYSSNQVVVRSIVLENTSTYKRYSFDVGSITNGDYKVTLRVSDGKDKTRAWYDAKIDISSLPSGVYAIYVKTASDGYEDYGELSDLFYSNINESTVVNGKKAYLRRVDEKRFRIELVIE